MENSRGFIIEVGGSADVYIKQTNINITQGRYSNWMNEIEIKIDDDFNVSDTTVKTLHQINSAGNGVPTFLLRYKFRHFISDYFLQEITAR